MRAERGLALGVVALATLAVLPLAAIVIRGFAPGAGATWSHLASTVLGTYAGNTLALVVMVGLGVAFGGTAAGWLVARRTFPGSSVFAWALLLPLAMPAYVMAYAYTDFLEYAGPLQSALRTLFGWRHEDYWFPDVRSLPGAAAMLTFTLYPYVYLLARTAFVERSPSLVEAARTMGLDARATFWRVELPLARPAIAGGVALALMETLADFGTVAYFGIDTLTTGIYRTWFTLGDRAAAAQLATALLALTVAALVLERASRGAARTSTGARGHAGASTRPALRGLRAAAATGVCTIAVAVGFALPVALLLRLIALEPALAVDPRFGQWIWNSLRVAALAALLAVAAAMLAAYAVRLDRGRLTRASARMLTLGYAVPGTVLAIGVLLPLGGIDAWLADLARRGGDPRPGLLLTGTVVALIYAYVVRYFAVAWNGIEPGLGRITPAMDAASRSLGSGAGATFARVHAPLLARSTAAALLLVFVDVMKELPATLVLRPFNFETLATQTFQLTRDERLTEAALPSLAMVVVGLVPIVMLARAARRTVASRRGTAAPATTIASA